MDPAGGTATPRPSRDERSAERPVVHEHRFVPGGTPSPDFREVHRKGGRGAEEFYRERRHDKEVRSVLLAHLLPSRAVAAPATTSRRARRTQYLAEAQGRVSRR